MLQFWRYIQIAVLTRRDHCCKFLVFRISFGHRQPLFKLVYAYRDLRHAHIKLKLQMDNIKRTAETLCFSKSKASKQQHFVLAKKIGGVFIL
jgi:hypothetical protein